MSGRIEGRKNIFSEENMTLYENVATSTLINLFNSPNREEYKTKIIYDFLLNIFGKRFEDISFVEEQASNDSNTSIPDFVINFIDNTSLRYEVKINNASLTESEKNETERDVFLIPLNYKYKDKIPNGKIIIYWEDLFDELDNQDIVIDGLDKVRNIINYPKQNLVGKTWEVIANLKDSWPEVQMDLRNVAINKNLVLYIPLFPEEKDENDENDVDCPLLSIEKERENLVLYKKRRTQYRQCCEIMTVAEFKRTSDCYQIALKFYNKIFENLTEDERKKYNLSQTDINFYNSVLKQLNNDLSDISLGDGYFSYKQNQYVYFIKLKEENRYEIGFGNDGRGFSPNVQNNLAHIRNTALEKITNKDSIRNYKNSKWVCTRFYVNGENRENQFLSAIKAMLG